MSQPTGNLTPAQFEIMVMLWDAEAGLTVTEIWERICEDREVNRTTALNLVDRLENRGWLSREKVAGLFRYTAAVDRETTESRMASQFVGEFFDGSPSSFVMRLLGSKNISKTELQRLRMLLSEEATAPKQAREKDK